jgi:hypothetical protein
MPAFWPISLNDVSQAPRCGMAIFSVSSALAGVTKPSVAAQSSIEMTFMAFSRLTRIAQHPHYACFIHR